MMNVETVKSGGQLPSGKHRYWWKAIVSFMVVLFTMPLGHGLMILMADERYSFALCRFCFGSYRFADGSSRCVCQRGYSADLMVFFGGLLFWTGWVEFLFMYYANRFGTQPELDPLTGEVVTRPEYLILPATFGFWMMVMLMYLFSTKNGCNFINWWQRLLFRGHKTEIAARPMTRHVSIVTFMELMMILWSSYLLLMFCYDDVFLGEHHPLTLLIGIGCLVGSFFIFAKQLRLASWGANIRMAIATVIVFWTPVEILGRMNLLSEIWVAPLDHKTEMVCILVAFIGLTVYLCVMAAKKRGPSR